MAEKFTTPAKVRNYGCRVTVRSAIGHLQTVVLENEKLRITVLAGRGADVVEFLYKPKDLDFAWLTSTGVRGNALPDLPQDDLDSFMSEYPGGWQTIFPNGGAPSQSDGIIFGQHAEVSVLPWEYEVIEDSPERSSVKFMVNTRKLPFRVEKTFTLVSNSTTCEIEERITNLSEQSHKTMWGLHFTFGPPFLDSDSTISVSEPAEVIPHDYGDSGAVRRVGTSTRFAWPLGRDKNEEAIDFSKLPPAETPGEMLYVHKMPSGWYQVTSPAHAMAAKVTWDNSLFPYLWYWQEYGYSKDAPWLGKHYNIGLEPFSSYPTSGIADAIANGTALNFNGHESKTQKMTFEVYDV